MKMSKLMKVLVYFFYTVLFAISTLAQTSWEVPADRASKTSPYLFDENMKRQGEELYKRSCASCHGMPGEGNNIKTLLPIPPDVKEKKVQNQSDGALFYKITEGRGAMPSFKYSLSEKERWQIISFIRSFNENYVQPPLAKLVDSAKIRSVKVMISTDSLNYKIRVNVSSFQKTDTLPLSGAEVSLFAKRYFGNLPIDSMRVTSLLGEAIFNFPNNLPGDSFGRIPLIIKINHEMFGEIEKTYVTHLGVPTIKPPLTEKNAMWNIGSKAPRWLIISYILVVGAIWFFLVKIIISIFKIKKLGKNTKL